MSDLTYINHEYKAPKRFKKMPMYGVKAIRNKVKKSPIRILFVFDHIFTEDLQARKMFTDSNAEKFFAICKLATEYYGAKYKEEDVDWVAMPYNQFKTYGRENDDIRADANESFAEHIRDYIVEYKPTVVVTFGKEPFSSLCEDALARTKNNFTNHLGTSVPQKFVSGDDSHKCVVVPTLSMNTLFGMNVTKGAYLCGYVARNLVAALDGGEQRYNIPQIHKVKKGKFIPKYKTHYLTKVKDVLAMLKKMSKEKFVSIDTETENLLRIYNKVQTVQFCCDPKEAYIVPIFHTDSPFTKDELQKIISAMRDYFEFKNQNKLQIYTNAKFDLNVMRTNFGVRYFKAKVWDICAGEFALDENMKLLANVTGKGYYNLGNLAVQYGCFAFYDNPFGKESRAHIADNPLTEPVLQYCSLDVVVPWLIFKQQLQRAKDIDYKEYRTMVSAMVGDQIHAFSTLESTGALCDIEYLFSLKMPDSPINGIIANKEEKILDSKPVKRANELISAGRSVPTQGLFGKVALKHFDISKSEHKQILFFDVLGLKPLEEGKKKRKNGKQEGKIGKAFQKKYASNEIVSAFTDLQKAYKIRNSYVNSFITKFGEDIDFRKTSRLRPTYSYQDVVTGRTSASDPNLQQIPSRGPLSKYIKRLLISTPGTMLIKVDYSAHEVRGWSIISGDKEVAETFNVGTRLRQRYRMVPDPWIAKRIDLEGDVHKVNAAYFFGLPIEQVTKPIRDAVKTVIFGLIYQQGDKGLADSTGRSVKEIGTIKKQFLDRFPVGLKWFDVIKNYAKEHFFVESPVGRRRTLWPLMFHNEIMTKTGRLTPQEYALRGVISKCLRQSVNSPVQGFGSDLMMLSIRLIDKYKYDYYREHGVYPQMNLNVSVHDSLTVEVNYEWFWLAIQFIERAMTVGCKRLVEKRYKYEMISTPEIDFEIGATERDVEKWDFSYDSMEKLIRAGLKTQVEELKHKIDVEAVVKNIMKEQYKHMPLWLQKQMWANGNKAKGMGENPLTKEEIKLAKQYHSEKPDNLKALEKYKKELAEREAEAELRSKQNVAKSKKQKAAA